MTMLQTSGGTQMSAGWKTAMKWLIERYREYRERRRALTELRSIDGRTLKDIGIDRTELTSIVYGNPNGRRRRYTKIESPFEGRRWCDTERELISGITNYPAVRVSKNLLSICES